MSDNFKFEVRGDKDFSNYIEKLLKVSENPQKIMAKSSVKLLDDVKRHFRNSQGDNGYWKPLKHRDGKPLLDTGTLEKSISSKYGKDFAAVGTNLIYAATHNYGRKKGKIPKRKFMWLSEQSAKDILNLFIQEFKEL